MTRRLIPSVVAVLVLTLAMALPARASEASGPANCSDYGGTIAAGETVRGNLIIDANGQICTIAGTVEGNVMVTNPTCTAWPPFTAASVVGGTVEGHIISFVGACTMIWLFDGAHVQGNVIHRASGNVGFLGNGAGARVDGNVLVNDGGLFASRASTSNSVGGHIICNGGSPAFGPGTASDWDGDGDTDGTIGKHYRC